MKPALLLLLMSSLSSALVGSFNDTNLTIGLFKQPAGIASKNTGTIIPVKGPAAPSSVSATFNLVSETYGWRSDLECYRFDSTKSNIVFSKDIGSLADNKLTVACWMRMAEFSVEKNIWAKVVSYTKKIVIHRQHPDTFQIRISDGSLAYVNFLRPVGTAEPDTWFSLVTVINVNETINTDRIKVYVNGIPCAMAGTIGTIPDALPYVDTVALRVGGWGAGDPRVGINGEMKYMLTFNTARTAADIAALYALGPDLGGLLLDSTGRLYSPQTFTWYDRNKEMKNTLNIGSNRENRYSVVDLSGRKITMKILPGNASMKNNYISQSGHSSGYYLIRTKNTELTDVSGSKVILRGK
ncbi:MAG: hypothetical protein JW915_09205 [Chitinispirillaceae bacterium]|nr:hypothetical protein [Chitinispirillaceae bacterium]